MKSVLFAAVAMAGLVCGASGNDIWVDNVRGDDAAAGTRENPFRTMAAAAAKMRPGMTMNLVSNAVSYSESFNAGRFKANMAGTVVDGHGAVLDGRRVPARSAWSDAGNGVWSIKCPNNAWVMDRQGYWSGHAIVFKDGSPLPWKDSLAALTDDSYFLRKVYNPKLNDKDGVHNTLYVKLPSGQDPETRKVSFPCLNYGINVETVDNITVRNVTCRYFYGDAFDSAWGRSNRFERVRGTRCMDQGISAHGSQVTVTDSLFDGNAGCGVVDCQSGKSRARTTYLGCTFADDSFRGGVEVQYGDFQFVNCIFRNNCGGRALKASNFATIRVKDCVFEAGTNRCPTAICVSDGSTGTVERCSFSGFTRQPPYVGHAGCALTVIP